LAFLIAWRRQAHARNRLCAIPRRRRPQPVPCQFGPRQSRSAWQMAAHLPTQVARGPVAWGAVAWAAPHASAKMVSLLFGLGRVGLGHVGLGHVGLGHAVGRARMRAL